MAGVLSEPHDCESAGAQMNSLSAQTKRVREVRDHIERIVADDLWTPLSYREILSMK